MGDLGKRKIGTVKCFPSAEMAQVNTFG